REVFTRDLAAASREGLLTLTGLKTPREFYGTSLETFKISNQGIGSTLEEAREVTGQFVGIDGLEYAVISSSQYQKTPAAKVVQEITTALRLTHLQATVNLNCAVPPDWANDLAEGPLFSQLEESHNREGIRDLGAALAEEWLGTPQAGRIGWHVRAADFEPGQQASLSKMVRHALEGIPILFIFDRLRRPISLAEGLDRNHPAVLLQVGLHLPKLLDQPGTRSNPDKFISKLGSLARLALSAGAQKRDYLRKAGRTRPGITRGFLLDRARLVVVPVGIETVVRELMGQGIGSGGSGLDFGRKIITCLREVLVQDAKTTHLESCLDSSPDFLIAEKLMGFPGLPNPPLPEAAGLTAWDETVPFKNQLKSGGILHGVAESGTAALMVPRENTKSPEAIVDLLRYALSHTDIVRLQIIREGSPSLAK
ncbi:MAG TPA: hypothetical protein VGY77_08960, partial [Gemmataceae bacterium]|nr:hypothetical protein [Gemmataceae bacterium]